MNPKLELQGWAAVCLFKLLTVDQAPDLHAEVSLPIEAWRDILHRVGYGEAQEELTRQILGIQGIER